MIIIFRLVFEEHFSGKNVFDLRDELTNTKRTLSVIKRERDAALIECSKLKSLLDKKEKDIEDLFIGGHVSNVDKNKVVSGTKNDTLLVRDRKSVLQRQLVTTLVAIKFFTMLCHFIIINILYSV
jgi:hypothetical protein